MEIIQRGNPSLMKSIQMGAKKVSESKGISGNILAEKQPINPQIPEAGAFASMQRMKNANTVRENSISKNENISSEKRLYERLTESVETLPMTKEYFNATSSLFTLYTMGKLTEGLMDSLSREDLREIKGIIREFKSVIDSY